MSECKYEYDGCKNENTDLCDKCYMIMKPIFFKALELINRDEEKEISISEIISYLEGFYNKPLTGNEEKVLGEAIKLLGDANIKVDVEGEGRNG
jgi:hypothetical protein